MSVETENQVDDQVDTGTSGDETSGAAAEKLSIRESLQKGFDDARKGEETAAAALPGKPVKSATKGKRTIDEMRDEATAQSGKPTNDEAVAPEAAEESDEPAATPSAPAPAAWSKEAKAEWANVPPAVQAAVAKREQDVQRGVDELKGRYQDIDQALAPHLPVIRQHGHTPAQAVGQLFAWFQSLSTNPNVAFPALMQSFGWRPPQAQQQAQVQPTTQSETQPTQAGAQLPPEVVNYIRNMEARLGNFEQQMGQRLGGLQQTFAQQQYAKTEEVMQAWAKDKPHFEAVRGMMAELIGKGIVPLKDGRVDLDTAYNQALRLNDELWAQTQQDAQQKLEVAQRAKEAARKKAAEDAAAKARAAATSIAPGAPGHPPSNAPARRGKGQTVRESLMAAINEART